MTEPRPYKTLRFPLDCLYRYADGTASIVLLALTIVGAWDLLYGDTVLGSDAATQFYPWYSFLGESLGSGDIPGWNPYQFSGTPFAGDPLSGWTYLPAMLLFTFLPLVYAAKGLMFLHLLLAGFFAYALARSLGIEVPGALLAAVAYEYSGFLYLNNTCCLAYTEVMVWLPLALLGAELAIRNLRPTRLMWWGVSGLALSQILAAWLGQGSYYALLTLGGYIAYRTLLSPPQNMRGIRARALSLALNGGAVLGLGFGLAAAGVLPRLEFNAYSNLAGGYPSVGNQSGNEWWTVSDWHLLLEPGYWYAGMTVLALALAAPIAARARLPVPYSAGVSLNVFSIFAGVLRGRYAVPFFSVLALGALVLSREEPTPLHSALYLLPYFERLHPHDADRIMLVFYLGTALLAGAALASLKERSGREPLLLVLPILAALLLIYASLPQIEVLDGIAGVWAALDSTLPENGVLNFTGLLLALLLVLVLVPAYALIPARHTVWHTLTLALLILVVFTDLFTANRVGIANQSTGLGVEANLTAYYRPSEAARFLQSRGGEEPFRYFGYDPELRETSYVSSPMRFAQRTVQALEPNNRATLFGLQNIQGYNAVHLKRYDEYIRALNGDEQAYHHADIYDENLDSPLLDLLNVRYMIVPADNPPADQAGLQRVLRSPHSTVYEDDPSKPLAEGRSKILENQDALPRAWIVHSARQVTSREEALDLLASGQIDPRETALLEEAPPEVSEPGEDATDQVSITDYEADRIRLETLTGAPGLLVLSEVYYPAWKAYVDGSPVPIYLADHLLRSVPVPEGEHTVELRYESWTLGVGVAVSLATCTVLVSLTIIAARYRRPRSSQARSRSAI